jgi:hypothetical protein
MVQKRLMSLAIASAITSVSGSACGMTRLSSKSEVCRVVGGEKLPTEVGGSDALCEAIERAIAARAPNMGHRVEVRVLSPSRLVATLTTGDGQQLQDLNHAVSDRALTEGSVERFAEAIALELAKAGPS